jgi:hypothetical protein
MNPCTVGQALEFGRELTTRRGLPFPAAVPDQAGDATQAAHKRLEFDAFRKQGEGRLHFLLAHGL